MNILEGLKSLSGKIKVEGRVNSQLDVSVNITLTKGYFMQEFFCYGRLYPSKYDGYIHYESNDWEENETKINDIKVGLSDFKKMLNSSGLSEIANSLNFTDQEKDVALYSVLEQNEQVKKLFGENVKLFDNLSNADKHKLDLKFVIQNYENISDSEKRKFNSEIGLEKDIRPTVDVLISYLGQLESIS